MDEKDNGVHGYKSRMVSKYIAKMIHSGVLTAMSPVHQKLRHPWLQRVALSIAWSGPFHFDVYVMDVRFKFRKTLQLVVESG